MPRIHFEDYVDRLTFKGEEPMPYKDYKESDPLDERGILKDHHKVRVSMLDAATARGEIESTRFTDTGMRITDATDSPLGLHRPGFRVPAGNQLRDSKRALADAYRAYDRDRENSWVDPNSNSCAGEQQFIGQREGDLCTRDGWPGRLRYNHEGNLECVLDHPNGSADHRTLDQKMEDHQLRMDEEYRAYARRKSEEWRGR